MRVMSVNPTHRLVTPRMYAAMVVGVLLVSLVILAGGAGSFFFNVILQGTSPGAFFDGAFSIVTVPDLVVGLFKAALFGLVAAIVACYRGSDRIVDTVAQLLDAAAALDEEVLAPHQDRLDQILDRLAPVVNTLATNRQTLIDALEALRRANEKIPRAIDPVRNDLWLFGILGGVTLPDGTPVAPGLLPLAANDVTMATLDGSPAAIIAAQFDAALGGDD